jgi:uncharacterized alpha-E superfamily protein
MLSRTADHMFWMARYTERAENIARMLDANLEAAMLPHTEDEEARAWQSMLGISGLQSAFSIGHAMASRQEVLDFLVRDALNPSSIVSCLNLARENARAVRGALTTELWETHNATWLMLQRHIRNEFLRQHPGRFFEWVKYRAHLARGVAIGTMLRDEAYWFIRLGIFLERADNTARILDAKFLAVPNAERSPSEHDFYYWASLLRSVSGFEIYRKAYRDVISPSRVAELLMLRADMPRSLLACMEEVVQNLAQLRNDASGATERLAGRVHAELKFGRIEEILEAGLHDYLGRFLQRIYEIGNGVAQDFLMPSTG